MYYNNANCDIYIGRGAGKMLLKDIDNAKQSVKIISPYLSPFLIEKLIDLHERDIDINLITSDDIEDYYGDKQKNIHKLILQRVRVDEKARKRLKKLKMIKGLSFIFLIALSLIAIYYKYFNQELTILYMLIPVFSLLLVYQGLKRVVKRKRIFHYSYGQLFPFKVFLSKGESRYQTGIHSKIYIIDDKVAYLGSLNFTKSGTQSNYETRIRTLDQMAVAKMIEEFNNLFNSDELPERDMDVWGSLLYREPIN